MIFTKGMRVVAKEDIDCNIKQGYLGTFHDYHDDEGYIEIAWDKNIGGHTLREKCQRGHGWIVQANFLKPIKLKEDKDGNLW